MSTTNTVVPYQHKQEFCTTGTIAQVQSMPWMIEDCHRIALMIAGLRSAYTTNSEESLGSQLLGVNCEKSAYTGLAFKVSSTFLLLGVCACLGTATTRNSTMPLL